MSDLNLYWAEEALGEPYAPQDYRWMKSTRRTGLMLGGATCILTVGALLGSAAYLQVDSAPSVVISSYEIEVVAHASPPAPAPAPPRPATIPKEIPVVRAARDERARYARASLPTPAPANARPSPVAAEGARPAKPSDTPKPTGAPAPAQAKSTPSAAAAAPAIPAAKPEPDTKVGISKGADGKPTDIASGEKLGIKEILPDGIVMTNGRKIKNGSALPNGEILMGTDAGKGMAETDRRVLVLTP